MSNPRKGVEYIATFNKHSRTLCYWQSRDTQATAQCDDEAAARVALAALEREHRAIPAQTLYVA